jgi:EmrB/QacA subfamily drug resistance transporter
MSMLDATIVTVALHTLAARLRSPLTTIQWVITAYLLAMAAVIPLTGWLARRAGPGRVYLAALLLFSLSSLGCGTAAGAAELIALRAVQGAAGGLLAVGQMLVVLHAGKKHLARAMAAVTLPMVLGPVIGPTIGGLLLVTAGWRWIFFVNVPVGLAATVAGLRFLPRGTPQRVGRPDVAGLALAAVGALALTYGLASGGNPAVLLAGLGAGAVLMTAFVLRSRRASQPLLDVRLFGNRVFSAAAATTFCVGGLISGGLVLMPLYYQLIRHQDALATGLLLIPQGAGAAAGIWLAGRATDRFGSLTVAAGGLVAAVGTIPLVTVGTGTPYVLLGAALALRGFGVGLAAMPAMTAAYRAIDRGKVSDASPQLLFLQRLGGSAATAAFVAVLQNGLDQAGGDPGSRAAAFGAAYWWVMSLTVLAMLPTLVLARHERRQAAAAVPGGTDGW